MNQPPFPMPAPATDRSHEPGPKLGHSISLLVVGGLIAVVSAVLVLIPLVGTFTSRAYPTPIHLSLHLHHARYTVFERSGTRSGFGSINSGPVTIDPSQVTVRDPDGQSVFVFRPGTTETITRNSAVYTGAVQFDAPKTGNYDIQLQTAIPTTVLITRSLGDAIRSVLVWIVTGAVGAIMLVGGLVMLIVGVTRRGRARRATQVGWAQPGWGQPAWAQPGYGQPGYGQPGYGQLGWGPDGWGQPQPYPPAQYPPPQYPSAQYPAPQYPPPQYAPPPPPPPASEPPPPPPASPPPASPPAEPDDPWSPQ
jgi:hypothetical protein